MKNVLYILLITTLFFSCKSNIKQRVKDSTNTSNSGGNQTYDLIQKFRPFIQGIWVKKTYMEDAYETKSPYTSRLKLRGVAGMQIKLPHSKSDSADVGYSLNNHEGGDFILYFKLGQKPNSLKINLPDYDVKNNFYEIGYVIKGNDTSLVLYHYDKNNHVIDSTIYTKVADEASDENDAGWGIQYIINKMLITGRYLAIDSAGATSKIEFTNAGKLSGFDNFKKFYISTDFEAGPENNIDQIGFYQSEISKAKWYSFKFQADTLKLYNIGENADSTLLTIGKLKYKLIRQK